LINLEQSSFAMACQQLTRYGGDRLTGDSGVGRGREEAEEAQIASTEAEGAQRSAAARHLASPASDGSENH
jgi:hypothetical protein